MTEFEAVATGAAAELGTPVLRTMAEKLSAGWPHHALLEVLPPSVTDRVAAVLSAYRSSGCEAAEAASFLRGLAAGHEVGARAVGVETVWTGPASHAVPVRATGQALLDVITEARHELVLMTYSAKAHPRIRAALSDALARGVRVSVIVETIMGAAGALSGPEPAMAFAGIPGLRLLHWPPGKRPEKGAVLHAKLAVADRRVLLVSSANLTQAGVGKNIEAGLLVHGGEAPVRVAEHLAALVADNQLQPLSVSS